MENIELPYDPVHIQIHMTIPVQDTNSKNAKTLIWKDTCTLVFIAALFTKAKTWKRPKSPSPDEWIKKVCVHTHTHTYNGILFNHNNKEWNLAICDNMDGPKSIMLNEISHTEKDKYSLSLVCGI